jgi:cytochrome c551/c552
MKQTARLAALIACLALSCGALAASQGEKLIAAKQCNRCHGAKTAPAELTFAAIAGRRQGQADALARWVDLLKTGGPGAHPIVAASDDDLKAIAAAVLSSK